MFQESHDADSTTQGTDREASPAFQALAERGQALAALLAARRFSLGFVSRRDGGTRFLPFIDSSYPGLSALSRVLTAPEWLSDVVAASRRTEPTVFGAPDQTTMSGVAFIANSPVAGETVVAFSVHSSCGRCGLVAVSGHTPVFDEDGLTRAHLRAFGLFRAACTLRPPEPAPHGNLTKRDIECLRLTADGLTSEQLAARLGLSVHTANQYVSAVVDKLDAVNRMHAVAKALRAGIIS